MLRRLLSYIGNVAQAVAQNAASSDKVSDIPRISLKVSLKMPRRATWSATFSAENHRMVSEAPRTISFVDNISKIS